MYLSPEQFDVLMKPLNATRVAKRSQGGKQLSYLEAWDVKAHLTRVFGFGNWDAEIIREQFMGSHPYKGREDKPMVEVIWQVTLQLTIRTYEGGGDIPGNFKVVNHTVYSEAAVGSATGGAESSGIGDLHDNAIKSAASDALKRCAINLGTQFGLSLYDNGSTREIIKKVLVGEPDAVAAKREGMVDPAKEAALMKSVGASGVADDPQGAVKMLEEQLGATPVEEAQVAPN